MALPGFMVINAENQGLIEGECTMEGHEGTIVVQGVDHTVKLPTDSRGLPNGRRVHMPITIVKEVDRTSPMLYQALSEGEILTDVTVEWYRYDEAGMEELYYKQIFKNAQIVSINFRVPNILEQEADVLGHQEEISFIYDTVVWSQEVHGIEYEDSFEH